ncbi:unnamed protein product [Paramecium pentaurelia]|uniref:Tr-type G domain-containing protein n=1 Tax=Paramecium pentaurelia TaxID=43138 RepID=A0A8S1TXY4_9CILI|nr:unnamed protein product [Paramecium pentaurelia]
MEDQKSIMLQKLQSNAINIRNLSIIAHVDHGKTTLTDQLISANNIISKRLAGNLRYMDSREDEQRRGITMKSSSIQIIHNNHLINLIDTPGHVEFSSEVQAALRLTDGALVLVDVLEGFSSQTFNVLKQMYEEGIKGVLVLNKVDRLILEKQMDPDQAFIYMSQIIEQVNAALSSFLNEQIHQVEEQKEFSLDDETIKNLETNLYFCPTKDNVVFCSSIDAWAFTVGTFSAIFAKKLKCNQQALQKFLWGNYYFQNKKVSTNPIKEGQSVLFVDFILKNIWNIYNYKDNIQKIQSIATQLQLNGQIANYKQLMSKWLPFDLCLFDRIIKELPNPIEAQRARKDIICKRINRQITKNYDARYDELYQSIQNCDPNGPLVVFVAKMISVPPECIDEKQLNPKPQGILSYAFARVFSGTLHLNQPVFVIGPKSKIINNVNQVDQTDIQQFEIKRIYHMMAQYLEAIKMMPAGNLVAIGGLDELIFKTSTISSVNYCPSFAPTFVKFKSIVKTMIMPTQQEDQPKVLQAIKKLYKCDPSLDVQALDSGEIVLGTCGEVHLQRCITDIEKLSECKVKISEPIVPFKETIIYKNMLEESNEKFHKKKAKVLVQGEQKQKKQQQFEQKSKDDDIDVEKQKYFKQKLQEGEDTEIIKDTNILEHEDIRYNQLLKEEVKFKYDQKQQVKKMDHKNKGKQTVKNLLVEVQNKSNLVEELTANQKIAVKVRAIGLPFELTTWIENNQKQMRKLLYENKGDPKIFLEEFDLIRKTLKIDKKLNELIENHLQCFGPKKFGPNLLINKMIKSEDSLIQKLKQQTLNQNQFPLIQQQQIIQLDFQQEVEEQNQISQIENKVESTKDSKSQLSDTTGSIAKGLELYLSQQDLSQDAMNNAINLGFDLALNAGPLCAEPIIGACFIIEQLKFSEEEQQSQQDTYGPISGQLISAMKDACINSFLGAQPRLVESVYKCTLQTDFMNYGKSIDVLNQRRGNVLNEVLNSCTSLFTVQARLPLSSSFDFYCQIQSATSGHVSAQLDFDGWSIIQEDPFYQPYTDDDIEENGIQKVERNIARDLIMATRKRKGMNFEEKIIVAADKQRNLSRKK